MAFLNNLKDLPVKNVLNVAMQTAVQHLPHKSRQNEYQQPGGSVPPNVPPRPQASDGFAEQQQDYGSLGNGGFTSEGYQGTEPCEMNPLNPFTNPAAFHEQDGIDHQTQYQTTSFVEKQGSVESVDSDSFAGGGEGGAPGVKITEIQAAWNVTNAIQGMFIVNLPFAVLRGGYWAIIAMVGIAYICCYTGKILVECLYEPDPQTGEPVRVRESYVAIAKVCFGKRIGARLVFTAQIIELLMTCILYVVVCGDLMSGTFSEGALDSRSWMMLCGALLMPLAFLKSIQTVSALSFWCTMSHLVVNAILLAYCLLEIGDWGWSKVKISMDFKNFPISLGVIVFSYTSQIFLPSLEGNMEDRSKFNWMLDWSHIAAAVFKAVFGYLCFLTFQSDTQQVISNNLHSPTFKGMVNFFLVIKAILSYPLPYYAALELLERQLFRGKPKTPFPSIWELDGELKVWGLAWRVGLVVGTILMAIFIPHFAILMGFIGSFTGTMLSFIWPCYFHLKLKGHLLDQKTIAYDYFIIFLGILFGVVGIYDSGSAMISAFEIALPF